jgi:TonB-linked SusC/RagA family outer membrane protein
MVIQPDGVARPYSPTGNNIKKFYQTGNTFSNTLTLNGGNETAQFRFSASNMTNNGIIPNSTIKRNTFSLSANANLSKRIIFEGNVQYNIENGHDRPYISDQPLNPNAAPMLLSPNIDIRMLRSYCFDERGYERLWHEGDANNPYFIIDRVKTNDDRRRLIGTFSTRLNIIKDYLYVRGKFGIDYYNVKTDDLWPTGVQYWTPSFNTSTSTVYETNAEGFIGFNKTFGSISIDAMAGGNQMHNVVDRLSLSSGELNVPFQYFITNGKSPSFIQGFSERAINSLFASANIGYHNYLYLNLSGRKDWFSTLPIKSNNLFYPSAGLSFIFSEVWSSKPDWFTYGKIRSSWAQVGGGAPDPYSLNLNYYASQVSHLGQPLMDINGSTVPNSSIKPYTSTTAEVGIELKMLNNRIGADVTLYNRETTNDIVSASIPSSSSYSTVLLNVGEVRNRGIEIVLNGTPVTSTSGITWDITYTMSYNKNTVIKIADGLNSLFLPNGEVRTKNGFIYHYEGMPFGQIAGYTEKRDANGNIVYNKATGLPVQSDFMALGNGVPPINLGLNNTFKYRNFTFSFLLDGKFGAKLYSATNAYGAEWGLAKRTVDNNIRETGVAVSGVDQDGQPYSATVPAQFYFQGISTTITNEFVYDASFVKLRQLTFGYSLPTSMISKTPFQSATLSIVARNLLLLYSRVPNVDPESTYNSGNAQGLEMYGVPPTRSLGINLMVRF